jgi:hypothetical protein
MGIRSESTFHAGGELIGESAMSCRYATALSAEPHRPTERVLSKLVAVQRVGVVENSTPARSRRINRKYVSERTEKPEHSCYRNCHLAIEQASGGAICETDITEAHDVPDRR